MRLRALCLSLLLTVFAVCRVGAEEASPSAEFLDPALEQPRAEIIHIPDAAEEAKPAVQPAPKAAPVAAPRAKTAALPEKKTGSESKAEFETPARPDDDVRAEVVALPPAKKTISETKTVTAKTEKSGIAALKTAKMPEPKTRSKAAAKDTPPKSKPEAEKAGKELPGAETLPAAVVTHEPGHPAVISGRLERDLEFGPADSPVLVRGLLLVPRGLTLKLKAGAVLQLEGDPAAQKLSQPGSPDPAQTGVIWAWGSVQAEGVTGNPIEIASTAKEGGALLLYGSEKSQLDGLRLKNVLVVQNGGSCIWTNCEFVNARHYALAAGAGVFTHCTFRACGGVFAAYDAGPWSLLLRKNVFDNCRDGVVLGSDPGETRLIVEKNHFLRTRSAHLRIMPTARMLRQTQSKSAELEFLIGENWYGTAAPEEVDQRIADRRADPSLKARLNIRPPAEQPYHNVGAGVSAKVLADTLREQQSTVQRLLASHPVLVSAAAPAPDPAPAAASEKLQTAMSKKTAK